MKAKSVFVDSGFVKTCDELVIGASKGLTSDMIDIMFTNCQELTEVNIG